MTLSYELCVELNTYCLNCSLPTKRFWRKFCSHKCSGIYHRKRGAENPNWKGAKALYASKHQYLVKNYGKGLSCERCGVLGKSEKDGRWSIQWAKKHGVEYSHNMEDYLKLCRSCHRKYDMTDKERLRLKFLSLNQSEEQRKKLSEKRKVIVLTRKRDAKGHFIKTQKQFAGCGFA